MRRLIVVLMSVLAWGCASRGPVPPSPSSGSPYRMSTSAPTSEALPADEESGFTDEAENTRADEVIAEAEKIATEVGRVAQRFTAGTARCGAPEMQDAIRRLGELNGRAQPYLSMIQQAADPADKEAAADVLDILDEVVLDGLLSLEKAYAERKCAAEATRLSRALVQSFPGDAYSKWREAAEQVAAALKGAPVERAKRR